MCCQLCTKYINEKIIFKGFSVGYFQKYNFVEVVDII